MSETTSPTTRGWVTSAAIIAAIIVLFGVSFALGNHLMAGTEFGGTDAAAAEAIAATGYRPWFTSLFTPGSSEVESGLFALQAALGAGVLGYVIGWFRARSKYAKKTT